MTGLCFRSVQDANNCSLSPGARSKRTRHKRDRVQIPRKIQLNGYVTDEILTLQILHISIRLHEIFASY